MPRPAAPSAAFAFLLTAALAACGGGDGGPEPVASVRFLLAADTLTAGLSRGYAATPLNGGGTPLAGRPVTYTTSDASRATVDAAGTVRALAAGPVTITATSEGRSAALTLDVRPAAPVRIVLAGVDSALVGDAGTLTARVFNTLDAEDPSFPVTFSSDAPAVASLDATGRVTALSPGTAPLTARVTAPSGQVLSAFVPYVVLAPVTALRILPRRVDQAVGASTPLVPQALDAVGTVLSRPVTFSGGGGPVTLVGTVAGGGRGPSVAVAGAAAGTATITATTSFRGRNVVTATVPVAVTPVAAGPYVIDVRFDGTVNPTYAEVFRQAATYWQRVISAALPAEPVVLAADECGRAHPAVNSTTTSVIIAVRVDSIDGVGRVLGSAGPCWLRDGPGGTFGLPAYGTMRFDSADVSGLVAQGLAYDVIRHEMGHVLGIGSMWGFPVFPRTAPLVTGRSTSAVAYVGEGGAEASTTLGFTGGSAPAPVEDQGGPGTANSHWREAVYDNELMTGFINRGANPSSRLTVRSLEDLGYAVNLAAAEPLLPPSASAAAVRAALRAARAPGEGVWLNDEVLPARFVGTGGGGRRRVDAAR